MPTSSNVRIAGTVPQPLGWGKHVNKPFLSEPAADLVELYARTYRTLLQSGGETRLRVLERPHRDMVSSLHAGAADDAVDMGALIYAIQRLPASIARASRVYLAQSVEALSEALGEDVRAWEAQAAPGRRRRWLWNGGEGLAALVASETDVDDLIPTLVAYQLEWNKLWLRLRGVRLDPGKIRELDRVLGVDAGDWAHLLEILDRDAEGWLRNVAGREKDFWVRSVGGTHVGFARAVRQWWQPLLEKLHELDLAERPLYFVSSNTHSIVNLLSGAARWREEQIVEYIERDGQPELVEELNKLRSGASRASWDNFLYFASRHAFGALDSERRMWREHERHSGIVRLDPAGAVEVAAQIVPLAGLDPTCLDARLGTVDGERLRRAPGVILNIDYPLGLAAYRILRVVAEDMPHLAGVYILGKAATLNASVGDVMVSNVVWDEHTGNTYWLDNCFTARDVAPHLVFGSALDGQRAVTVLGTFLQNHGHLERYYRETFTVVEMEAGPYLSAVYEAASPMRHPVDEHVNLTRTPFDLGILHYASDTPYTQARTLGARGLSYRGVDSTYAGAIAIVRRIIAREGIGE